MHEVLVVDDDPLTCELIQDVLRSAEIESQALTDSAKAAVRLKEKKFDAAFLDMRMPSPDGIDLVRQMRSSGLNQKTFIVMITGESDRHFLTRAFQAGANFVLFKPVDRQALLRLLRVTQGPIERERRRFTRVSIQCKVSLEIGSALVDGTTLDMSVSGMMVQAGHMLPLGTLVRIGLELDPKKPGLKGMARVVRLVGEDCMGMEFEKTGLADNERLQEFLLPLILSKIDKDLAGVPFV
jgi:CheY-like chemotaxis protein